MILVACGVRAEVTAAGSGVRAIAGGGDPHYLAQELDRYAPHAEAVVSWGLAGGLAPNMAVGDWVVGTQVVGGFRQHTNEQWAKGAKRLLDLAHTTPGRVWLGPIHADDTLADVGTKRMLGRAGSLGVDMESHIAGQVAAVHKLPFLILRVVSDTVDDELPPAAKVAMGPRGTTNYSAIIRSLARQPGQLRAFREFAGNASRSLTALRDGRRALGGRLGFNPANLSKASAYVI